MSGAARSLPDDRELQREITRVALTALDTYRFALAGGTAIREHGFTDRLTRDVDLFTNVYDESSFARAVDHVTDALERAGHTVNVARQAALFAELHVGSPSGARVQIDMAYDWRDHEPERFEVGPVLSMDDAVAAKANAIYSRTEARDFIDLDGIRASGRYTDDQIIHLIAERDAGFDRHLYAGQLEQVQRIHADRFAEYGLDEAAADGVRVRTLSWAVDLRR